MAFVKDVPFQYSLPPLSVTISFHIYLLHTLTNGFIFFIIIIFLLFSVRVGGDCQENSKVLQIMERELWKHKEYIYYYNFLVVKRNPQKRTVNFSFWIRTEEVETLLAEKLCVFKRSGKTVVEWQLTDMRDYVFGMIWCNNLFFLLWHKQHMNF